MLRGSVPLALTVLLVALLLAGPARSQRPEIELELAGPSRTVVLGEKLALQVRLVKRTGKPVQLNGLALARNSISLRVDYGQGERTLTRIYGVPRRQADGDWAMEDEPTNRETLRRGRPLTLEVPLVALWPGAVRLRAVYAGRGPEAPLLESPPVVLQVAAPEREAAIGAVMETSAGRMRFRLWPERTPNTVLNFLLLAEDRRYDGLTFHRIVPGFMVQGGDPKGTGTGGPGWSVPDEVDPGVTHDRGVLSMARSAAPDSAGSQFFVMIGANDQLDETFTAFGRLVEGEEVLDQLATTRLAPNSRTGEMSQPVEPPVIKSIRMVVE